MTLPPSGPISASDINLELGLAANAPFSIGSPACRSLAGVPSGPIFLSDFYGKSIGGGTGPSTPGPAPGPAWIREAARSGTESSLAEVALSVITLISDGTTLLEYGASDFDESGPGKNWSLPTFAGIGSSYWARITITSADLGSGPISVTTAYGSVPDPGSPYTCNWLFSDAPGVWHSLTSGFTMQTSITVPGGLLVNSIITITGEIEFAASPGGAVIYQDSWTLQSQTTI